MSDRFRMSDSAPACALLIVVAAIAILVLIGAAVGEWTGMSLTAVIRDSPAHDALPIRNA